MTIDFLSSIYIRKGSSIEQGEEFAVHPEATHWSIDRRVLRFHRCNFHPTSKMKEIPRNSNTMRFSEYKVNRGDIDYGVPEFRGHWANAML